MSDRIAVLNGGSIEQIGTVAEIYHHPTTRFVAEFIGETNILHAKAVGQEGDETLCQLEDGTILRVQNPQSPASGPVLLSVRPEKVEVFSEKPTGPNVFPGTISLEIFKGAVDDLIVTADRPLQIELSAMHANASDAFDFHEGERVYFRISPANISLLLAEKSTPQ